MKPKLYIITLEPISSRYTLQWYTYFKKEFSKFFNVEYIDGNYEYDDKIVKGRFLDINKTNKYKAQQVEKISIMFEKEKIHDGDYFFFADGWHFGLTALKYMAQLNDIKIKIYGFLHAGSWDKNDYITQKGLGLWCCYDECAWINILDGCFVATNFHKQLIEKYFRNLIDKNKIYVIGFPMNWRKEVGNRQSPKENIVVFPHRLDEEKYPKAFDWLKTQLHQYQFIKTVELNPTKDQYYDILAKAKVVFSASLQETFGIGTVEGLMLGAVPVVPDRLSYVELYNKEYRYDRLIDAKDKINYIMVNYSKHHKIHETLKLHQDRLQENGIMSIQKMAEIMLSNNERRPRTKSTR